MGADFSDNYASASAENAIQDHIRQMDTQIRKRVQRGMAYNMKIVIRGAPGTGKTSLWHLIQGKDMPQEHVPTGEIQASTIIYNYTEAEEVKVDVWDIVDKGISQNINNSRKKKQQVLDASTIDVYRHTNAVLLLVHPQSLSSLQYAREIAMEVSDDIPLLLLLNFRDLGVGDTTAVTMSQVRALQEEVNRKRCNDNVFALEISCVNCLGMMKLHKFLSIPFLLLKQRMYLTLLQDAQQAYADASTSLLQSSRDDEEKEEVEKGECRQAALDKLHENISPSASSEPLPPPPPPTGAALPASSPTQVSAESTPNVASSSAAKLVEERSPSPPKQLRRKKKSAPNEEISDAKDTSASPPLHPSPLVTDSEVDAAAVASPLRTKHHVAANHTAAASEVTDRTPAVATPPDDLDTFAPSTSSATLDNFLAYHSDEESAIVERRNKIRACAKTVGNSSSTVRFDEDEETEIPKSRNSLRSVRKSRKK